MTNDLIEGMAEAIYEASLSYRDDRYGFPEWKELKNRSEYWEGVRQEKLLFAKQALNSMSQNITPEMVEAGVRAGLLVSNESAGAGSAYEKIARATISAALTAAAEGK